jgi:DNA repair exonuclease SbcCD ATPase subunit
MSGDTKAMEEALQAAVAKMNRPSNGGSSTTSDMLSALLAVLPKLLENGRDDREDIAEKLDGLQTEEFAPMREQLRQLRMQVHRVRKTQDEVLSALEAMREQQTAIGEAVLQLARQMSRIELLDEANGDDIYDSVMSAPIAATLSGRASTPSSKTSSRTRKHSRHERS